MTLWLKDSFLLLIALLSASQASLALSGTGLDVRLHTGTYRGVATTNGTEQWLGIPYAEAPTGSRRFKAPVTLSDRSQDGLKDASSFGNACPQPASNSLGAAIGEDCLFLNVWRPQHTSATAKLPVLVYFHGGAFTTGSGSAPGTNPTLLVKRSIDIHRPIISVSVNYRLNTFGFLASSLVPKEDLNAAFSDQLEALRFLQSNIAAFGGDPEKITIWGQSAGGGSVESLILYAKPEEKLFRAGMADSSTGPFKSSPPPEAYDKPGDPFTRLLSATGCVAGPEALNCLRDIPFDKLHNISNTFISNTLHGQLWQPTISPGTRWSVPGSQKKKSGDFIDVPYLAGTNVNEGAAYATSGNLRNLNLTGEAQNAAFSNFIYRLHAIDNSSITDATITRTEQLYAENDPTLGAPFNQNDPLYDRAEVWYTEEMYLAPRRLFFESAAKAGHKDLFGYYFKEFLPGGDPTFGVTHASELVLFFGPVADSEIGLSHKMSDFYINFINDMNPGPEWPRYDLETRSVLQLLRDNITVIPDDWNKDRTDFLNTNEVLGGYQK